MDEGNKELIGFVKDTFKVCGRLIALEREKTALIIEKVLKQHDVGLSIIEDVKNALEKENEEHGTALRN